MSRHSLLRTAVIVGLTLLVAAPAGIEAQQTEAELEARIRELIPELEAAREANDRAKERRDAIMRTAAAEAASTDTIQVGALRVVGLDGQIDDARDMYESIWSEFETFAGGSPGVREAMFTYQLSAVTKSIFLDGPHYRAEGRLFKGRSGLEDAARQGIGRALETDLTDSKIYEWVRGRVVPPAHLDDMFRYLAVSNVEVLQNCLEGVPGTCLVGLDVEQSPDAWRDWFTPQERQAMLTGNRYYWWGRRGEDSDDLRRRCTQNDMAACDAYFEPMTTGDVRRLAPLNYQERLVLLWVAVERGGEGAWERLLERKDTSVEEALTYASGATILELEAEWLDLIISHRPDVKASLGTTRWMALLWIMVFAALAMRSTRWRLA